MMVSDEKWQGSPRHREASARGGRNAHASGKAHQWTSEEARVAGRKGGLSVSRNRNHMHKIGAVGSKASSAKAARLRMIKDRIEDKTTGPFTPAANGEYPREDRDPMMRKV